MYKYIILAVPLIMFVASLAQSWLWYKFNDTKVTFNMGTVYLNSAYPHNSTLISAQTMKDSVEFVDQKTGKDEPFLAVPYMAGLYFLLNRPSQTYVDNIFVGFLPDEQKYINEIEKEKINVVIYDPENGPQSTRPKLRDYYPKLDHYLMTKFNTVIKTKEGWLFMTRKL